MNVELRKRLEEAAEKRLNCATCLARKYGECKGSKCLPYRSFLAGAEYGYKEAIAFAKEWLSDCIHNEEHISSHPYRDDKIVATFDYDADKETILSDFEAEMNKLWEEDK